MTMFSLYFLVVTISTILVCTDKSSSLWCRDNSFLCKSPNWISRMIENCQRTCNYCTMTLPPTTTSGTTTTSECGNPRFQTGRVIAGATPKKGAWPWQTLLFENGIEFCGGTLIHREWILTAAHCIHGKEYEPAQIVIRTGEHIIDVNEGTEENIEAVKIIKHKEYNPLTHDNDVALIKLARPCKLNNHVSTACLPSNEATLGTLCFITGWGKTSHPGNMTNVLQQGKMSIVDQTTCESLNRQTIPHPITKAMLCAGDGGLTRMSGCHGDSGGPLVCSIGGRWSVHGTVSHGSGECRSDETYTVFAKVSYFKSWISSIITNDN
ncbi:trypsin-3 isoform X1 [Hydra vulgaris]|uniref:trypsin-3 isoform X1 n=2 Tax=Hydra vulgaris TaxID=6087 RepID=UPI00064137F1|nr:trypsin-3 isoform X1 [Hydra vulgaris]